MNSSEANSETHDSKDIKIELKFGDDSTETILTEFNLKIFLGQKTNEENMTKLEERLKQAGKEDDVYFVLKFHVVPGREKQAMDFLQKGMDEPDGQELMSLSPVQQLLQRPKSSGKVRFEQKHGLVIISYCFYQEYIFNNEKQMDETEQEFKQLFETLSKNNYDPKITLRSYIRGHESSSTIQDSSHIFPNYAYVGLTVENFQSNHFFNLLSEVGLLGMVFEQSPILRMITYKCKSVDLNFQFSSLRKLIALYRQSAHLQAVPKPDPFIHKNLLKNVIQIEGIWKKLGYCQAEVKFHHENHFQRVLKVCNRIVDEFFR